MDQHVRHGQVVEVMKRISEASGAKHPACGVGGQRIRKIVMAGLVAAALVLAPALPAAATDVYKDGTQSCGSSTPFSYLVVKGRGTLGGKAPGKGSYVYRSYSTTTSTTFEGASYGGAWSARSSDVLVGSGTYAFCSAAG